MASSRRIGPCRPSGRHLREQPEFARPTGAEPGASGSRTSHLIFTTTLPFARLVAPFLIGRFVSYSFWTLTAAAVSRKLQLEDTDAMAYFSVYFVLTQLALLAVVYAFTRLDWKLLLQQRKWRWLPKSPPDVAPSA